MDRQQLIDAFSKAWADRQLEAVMDLMAKECWFSSSVGPDPGRTFTGRSEVRRGFGLFLDPPPDPRVESEVVETVVSQDFAVVRWVSRPTAGGSTAGGSSAEVRACDVFEFAGELIRSKDTYRKIPG